MAESAVERAYRAIKTQLLTNVFAPGEHLDVKQLSEQHDISQTPVREVLNRLAGEQLVDSQINEGFFAAKVTEPTLRDLYDWTREQLVLAVKARPALIEGQPAFGGKSGNRDEGAPVDVVLYTERLFSAIAGMARNRVYQRAIISTNDHLHAVRRMEGKLLSEQIEELDALRELFDRRDNAGLEAAMNAYHDRRRPLVPDLVELLHRARARAAR